MFMYQGKRRFTRDQLVFVVEVMITSALDTLEQNLPTTADNKPIGPRDAIVSTIIENLGWNLSIFYAQLTDDGMGVSDALDCAGKFYEKIESLVEYAWKNGGKHILAEEAKLVKKGAHSVYDAYGKYWPDPRRYAEKFVTNAFGDYLKK